MTNCTSRALLTFWVAALAFAAAGHHRTHAAEAPAGPFEVPAGYVFHDYVEFTDRPNHGRPHVQLHDQHDGQTTDIPQEGAHTLLITPDGRAYKKPLSDSLAELKEVGGLLEKAGAKAIGRQPQASRRQLHQAAAATPVPPGASLGVSTSGDLSCNGCGPDNRVQVTDTTMYPYMTVGQLIGQLGTSSVGLECTGTLIGQRHVLTAAHCVFDINASRKMVSQLNFAPALDGSSPPYGTLSWTQARIVTMFSSQPSYTTTAMNYDFALITLAQSATSGYLGLFYPPGNTAIEDVALSTAGYPGSKPSGTMWSSACGNTSIDYSSNNAFANVAQCANGGCSNILTHTCISSDGQSGSGMWDNNFQIRAILTGKVTTSDGNAFNVATEIDSDIYNQLASWYNEDGDPAGNGTLPLAPSGPGSKPAAQNSFQRWWNDHWGKPWFIAVVIFVGLTILGVLFLTTLSVLRCCGCFDKKARPVKAVPGGVPVSASAAGSRAGLPPRPPQPLRPEGVTYNTTSGQFMVNGQQYGTYQGGYPSYPNNGYQHGRTPSTTPLFR